MLSTNIQKKINVETSLLQPALPPGRHMELQQSSFATLTHFASVQLVARGPVGTEP